MGAVVGQLVGQGAGSTLSVIGQGGQLEAKQKSAKHNIREAQRIRAARDAAILREGTRAMAANRVAVAKSGVKFAGSPVEVAATNAALITEQRRENFLSIQSSIELIRAKRQYGNLAAGLGMAGSLVGGAGNAAETLGST